MHGFITNKEASQFSSQLANSSFPASSHRPAYDSERTYVVECKDFELWTSSQLENVH